MALDQWGKPINTSTAPTLNTTVAGQANVPQYKPPAQPPVGGLAAPDYANKYGAMYENTFSYPTKYWNEYSQGQGTKFVEGAGRAMAKAGRTGMLPTLNTLAHQDYMSNYLPSVRKDLSSLLSYEGQQNQNLTAKYGHELGFKGAQEQAGATLGAANIRAATDKYNADLVAATDKYNADLDFESKQLSYQNQIDLANIKSTVDMYNIDETTKSNVFNTMGQIWGELSDQDRQYFLTDLKLAVAEQDVGETSAGSLVPPDLGTTITNP